MTFPPLGFPPTAVYDSAKVRLGDGFISTQFPAMTSRRALLRTSALFPVALVAVGCTTVSDIVKLTPKIASFIDVIAKVAAIVSPIILGLTTLSTNVKDTIALALKDVQEAAAGIAAATTATAGVLVQKIGSGVGTVTSLLAGLAGLPAAVGVFITNAVALIPDIEAAVGIKSSTTAMRFAATISPDQAYANLAATAARR